MNILKNTLALLFLLLITSCAHTPPPPLVYNQDAVVESMSTGISLSLQTSEKSISGNGFMVYRRPDNIHMILLSPFGTTVFEVFALGNQITLVYPSQGVAYTGHINQLPKKGGVQGWSLMRWVMDADPVGMSKKDGTYERVSNQGIRESITVINGLITRKANPDGDQVYYEDYSLINGVPLASVIDIRNKQDDRIRLKLQDIELNTKLNDAVFVPRLDGLKLLPISELELE